MKIEICCYSADSARTAEKAGANRIELCAARAEGGLTPSMGLVENVLSNVSIPVYVMIRPRGGDFLYTESEFSEMKNDILWLKKQNVSGFVFGVLDKYGRVDMPRMRALMDCCGSVPVTFHRAFDMTQDPLQSLADLIDLGIENVLTSGQRNTAIEGISLLRQMVELSRSKINIMAGSGVSGSNFLDIIKTTGVQAIHLSAKKAVDSSMVYRNQAVKMGSVDDEYTNYEVDEDLVRKISLSLSTA